MDVATLSMAQADAKRNYASVIAAKLSPTIWQTAFPTPSLVPVTVNNAITLSGNTKKPDWAGYVYSGAPVMPYTDITVASAPQNSYRPGQAPNVWGGSWRIAFDFDGASFETTTFPLGAACSFIVWTDGVPHVDPKTPQTIPASASRYLRVDYGAMKAGRRVVLELIGGVQFNGITFSTDGCMSAPSLQSLKLAWIGDSYGAGVGANTPATAFTVNLCRLLGIRDFFLNTSVAATGIMLNGGTAYTKYRDRIAVDVAPLLPDIVVVQQSVNDNPYGSSQYDAAVIAEYTGIISDLRAISSRPKIITTSPLAIGVVSGGIIHQRDVVKAQAAVLGIPYVDAIPAVQWFTGNGSVESPAGSGNADVYATSAAGGNHPTQLGHDYLARKMAPLMAQALGVGF